MTCPYCSPALFYVTLFTQCRMVSHLVHGFCFDRLVYTVILTYIYYLMEWPDERTLKLIDEVNTVSVRWNAGSAPIHYILNILHNTIHPVLIQQQATHCRIVTDTEICGSTSLGVQHSIHRL